MKASRLALALLVVASACKSPSGADATLASDDVFDHAVLKHKLPLCAYSYGAFALGELSYGWSDVQGYMGAVSDVKLQGFGLGTELPHPRAAGLVCGGDAELTSGSLSGSVLVAGDIKGSHADWGTVELGGTSHVDAANAPVGLRQGDPAKIRRVVQAVVASVEKEYARHTERAADARPVARDPDGKLRLAVGAGAIDYQRVAAADLAGAREIAIGLPAQGNPTGWAVVLVSGAADVRWLDSKVSLSSGLKPEQIVWVFVDAARLTIARTADGTIGIPGFVLAPRTDVSFHAGLITGGLIARHIHAHASPMNPGGQVNKAPPGLSCQ